MTLKALTRDVTTIKNPPNSGRYLKRSGQECWTTIISLVREVAHRLIGSIRFSNTSSILAVYCLTWLRELEYVGWDALGGWMRGEAFMFGNWLVWDGDDGRRTKPKRNNRCRKEMTRMSKLLASEDAYAQDEDAVLIRNNQYCIVSHLFVPLHTASYHTCSYPFTLHRITLVRTPSHCIVSHLFVPLHSYICHHSLESGERVFEPAIVPSVKWNEVRLPPCGSQLQSWAVIGWFWTTTGGVNRPTKFRVDWHEADFCSC